MEFTVFDEARIAFQTAHEFVARTPGDPLAQGQALCQMAQGFLCLGYRCRFSLALKADTRAVNIMITTVVIKVLKKIARGQPEGANHLGHRLDVGEHLSLLVLGDDLRGLADLPAEVILGQSAPHSKLFDALSDGHGQTLLPKE